MRNTIAQTVAFAFASFFGGVIPTFASPTGPAATALTTYMASTRIPCYTQAGEGTCTIATLNQDTRLFYGKPDPASDAAVAFVTYQYDATGNGMDQMAIVLRLAAGKWSVVGRADNTVGSSPRNVLFAPGAITYVGNVMGARDDRANPRGKGKFRLNVSESGVTFAGKSAAIPPAPKQITGAAMDPTSVIASQMRQEKNGNWTGSLSRSFKAAYDAVPKDEDNLGPTVFAAGYDVPDRIAKIFDLKYDGAVIPKKAFVSATLHFVNDDAPIRSFNRTVKIAFVEESGRWVIDDVYLADQNPALGGKISKKRAIGMLPERLRKVAGQQ